ncbi:MAG: FAD-dependent oxidoreductase [Chloroflexi bacterium]|nr:MAG: FAD-dependent oxidoreductase [Chloroflexota bacterium]
MQNKARLVIIGGGIVGCSAAYHLVQMGWRDIVVLDQSQLYQTGGSTSHAPGLVFQTNPSRMMTAFARYTVDLFNRFHTSTLPTVYPVGGIEVAYTPERWAELQRKLGFAQAYGLEAYLLSPQEVRQKIPIIDETRIHGGYYVPTDCDVIAVNGAQAWAQAAQAGGAAEFHGDIPVTDIEFETGRGRVTAVVTPKGRIETEQVLLCTNIWSPILADKVGLKLPLMAVEHQYAVTTPLPELAGAQAEVEHPILRHQDRAMYFRQHRDAYGIGSYNHAPLLVDPHDLDGVHLAERPFTPEHFAEAWEATNELLPATRGAGLTRKFNGMFTFTVDGMPIMGEAPHLKGFWVAVGVWVTHSGGVGKAIAEWMTTGDTEVDVREANINRFYDFAKTKTYIQARCYTQYDEVYDIIHPFQQMENPRRVRVSPFYPRLQELGAVFFESAGWERPQWLEANRRLLNRYRVPSRSGWEARYWSPIQGAEHLATRERVALYDLTAFAKFDVRGPGALAFLNYLAANQIDRPTGRVVYTALLTRRGGIRADLTITRTGPDSFLVLTGGATGMLDLAWLRQHAPDDGSVQITDVSSQYCAVGLWGPDARHVLQSVTPEDVSDQAFPYFTAQAISIDTVPAYALRVSYVGELGWEIYTPMEYGPRLWDVLWQAGEPFGIIAAGFGAFDSLRLEKGYRSWGADIHTEYNPLEAGLDWAVRWDKGDFLGREALLSAREAGVRRRLCCMTLDDPQAVALGKEPILSGDRVLGYVTSANYGYSVGQWIVYGYLPVEFAAPGTRVEVVYFGRRQPATVRKEPLR